MKFETVRLEKICETNYDCRNRVNLHEPYDTAKEAIDAMLKD